MAGRRRLRFGWTVYPNAVASATRLGLPSRIWAEIRPGFLKLIRARDADRILRDRPGRPTVNSQGSVQWRSHARSPWNQSRKNQQALEGRRRAFCRPSRAFFLWGTHPQGFRPGLLTDGLPGLLFQNGVKTVIVLTIVTHQFKSRSYFGPVPKRRFSSRRTAYPILTTAPGSNLAEAT